MAADTFLPEVYEHLRHLAMGTTHDDKDPQRETWVELCVDEKLTKFVPVYLDPVTGHPAAQRYEITHKGIVALRSQQLVTTPVSNNQSADVSKAEVNSSERAIERSMLAMMGDETSYEIIHIANQDDWPGEVKMFAILQLDGRCEGWESKRWATMLKVSPDAVRGYKLWKALHAKEGDDDEKKLDLKEVIQSLRMRMKQLTNKAM